MVRGVVVIDVHRALASVAALASRDDHHGDHEENEACSRKRKENRSAWHEFFLCVNRGEEVVMLVRERVIARDDLLFPYKT